MFDNNQFPGQDQKPENVNTPENQGASEVQQPAQQPTPPETPTPSYQNPFPGAYGQMTPPPPKEPKNSFRKWIVLGIVLYAVAMTVIVFAIAKGAFSAGPASSEPTTSETEDAQSSEDVGKDKDNGKDSEKNDNPSINENPSEDGKNSIVADGYTGEALSAAELYEKNVSAVVFVEATYARGKSTGSGFVIDSENGYIMTNFHVVEECEDIAVTFYNSDSYPATLVGGDAINDVAVLKIDAKKDIQHVTIGDSDKIRIGDDVLVIGNPLGDLTFTLTKGIVSGTERSINTGEYNINTFQTDAAINSGNSGGPAFDASGAVIGIASAKYAATGVEGIGFCIPINDAMEIARDLVDYGYVTGRPNFGITVSDSTGYEYTTDEWGRRVVVETMRGARIEEVGKGSCAEKGGLKAGDIVTKLDDTKIETANDLINAKNKHKAGDTVTLEVFRNNEKLTLKVTLDEYTPE